MDGVMVQSSNGNSHMVEWTKGHMFDCYLMVIPLLFHCYLMPIPLLFPLLFDGHSTVI